MLDVNLYALFRCSGLSSKSRSNLSLTSSSARTEMLIYFLSNGNDSVVGLMLPRNLVNFHLYN